MSILRHLQDKYSGSKESRTDISQMLRTREFELRSRSKQNSSSVVTESFLSPSKVQPITRNQINEILDSYYKRHQDEDMKYLEVKGGI